MRRWFIEETGEERPPKHGEYFLSCVWDVFLVALEDYDTPRKILRVSEMEHSHLYMDDDGRTYRRAYCDYSTKREKLDALINERRKKVLGDNK